MRTYSKIHIYVYVYKTLTDVKSSIHLNIDLTSYYIQHYKTDSHTMKIWERVVEDWLRQVVLLCPQNLLYIEFKH